MTKQDKLPFRERVGDLYWRLVLGDFDSTAGKLAALPFMIVFLVLTVISVPFILIWRKYFPTPEIPPAKYFCLNAVMPHLNDPNWIHQEDFSANSGEQ